MTQISIDFNKPIVHMENNAESQHIFESNEKVLRGQCKTIYEALMRGEKLTTTKALVKYKVGDFRRRIKDLKDLYGITTIQEKLVDGRFKEWFIPQL